MRNLGVYMWEIKITYKYSKSIIWVLGLLNEAIMWSKCHKNVRLGWLNSALWELQNKLNFIRIELQKAEIALKLWKINYALWNLNL